VQKNVYLFRANKFRSSGQKKINSIEFHNYQPATIMAPQYGMQNDEEYYDEPHFPKLEERRVSFNDSYASRSSTFYRRLIRVSQKEEWAVVSPMVRHVFPSERTRDGEPADRMSPRLPRLPRRRSRSFNDFIDTRDMQYGTAGIYAPDRKAPTPDWAIETTTQKKSRTSGDSPDTRKNERDIYSEVDDMPVIMSILYGMINCTIVLPVIMSFGNIIYRDNAFADYMPVLIKLTLFSGMVHQLCFSIFSTLRFAVGSVQDAGLIFLSKMAHDMVVYCRERNYDDEIMLATVTVGLGCSAAALGVGLIAIGKLGLASYVQMLPTCVVAGYLAFIGWFVGYSGLGIMAGESALTPTILVENLLFVLPGVAGGAFIYVSVRKLRHVAVLPLCITFLIILFYAILIANGSTVQEATEQGWIRKSVDVPAWNETWDFLKLDRVAWGALPQLWLTWLGMLFVVALSSSLDVAAIELEVKQPLNYNRELRVVGISNLISGLAGGYTGSYIFSQTIFSLRIGIRSRLPGFAIAFFCGVVIVMPFPIMSYVPNFFYGSLLSMICIDLMYEWLWEFRTKVTRAEYTIGLATFGLIQVLGVEYGIVAGVVVYVLCRKLGIDVGELKQMYSEEQDSTNEDDEEEGSYSEELIVHETTKIVEDGEGTEAYIIF
jgi:MFS superfamily sulfate permease-like transporter